MISETAIGPIRDGPAWNRVLRTDAGARPVERFPAAPAIDALCRWAKTLAPRSAAQRAALAGAVSAWNESLGNARGAKLAARLEDPHCLVIATGQQPALFGGPLLVAAKIGGAVALARDLESRLSRPVVPIFWNHAEDHDLDEANRILVPQGPDWLVRKLPIASSGRILSQTRITAEALAAAGEILEVSNLNDRREQLLPRLGESLSAWSARCVLASIEGIDIIMVDPAVVKPHLGAFFETLINRRSAVAGAWRTATDAVKGLGQDPQVEIGDGSPLFVIDETGFRRRVRMDGEGGLSIEGTEATPAVVLDRLRELAATDPSRLSTNVLARPLLLQAAWPVIAHVLGPAEISYFAQLPEAFVALGLEIPAAIPRPTLTILRPKEATFRAELKLDGETLLSDPDTWPRAPEDDAVEGAARTEIDAAVTRLAMLARGMATTADGKEAASVLETKVHDAWKRFDTTLHRERERSRESGRTRRRRLSEWVRPRGRWQERELSPWILLRGCRPGTLARILGGLAPLEFLHHIVTLGEEDLIR